MKEDQDDTKVLDEARCPTCKGLRYIYELDHDEDSVSIVFYKEKSCPKCNGTGKVKKK